MKRTRSSFGVVLCILVMFCFLVTTNGVNIVTNAQEYEKSSSKHDSGNDEYCCTGNSVALETEKTIFSDDENIEVAYYVDSEDYVTDVTCSSSGIILLSAIVDSSNHNRIIVELICNLDSEMHSL